MNDSQEAELVSLVRGAPWLLRALHAVRALGLPAWCIGAGAVRNLVWDARHGFAAPSHLPDVDVAHFDAAHLDAKRDAAFERELARVMPETAWDVTNQAAVHTWYEARFGRAVPPLRSLAEGVGTWPEYATCVGVTLRADDGIDVVAPHGLGDLFAMVVRRNPARVTALAYRARIAQKRFHERWPRVTIVD